MPVVPYFLSIGLKTGSLQVQNCVAIGMRMKNLDDLFFLGDPVYPHFDLSLHDLIFFSVFFLAFFPLLTIAECS